MISGGETYLTFGKLDLNGPRENTIPRLENKLIPPQEMFTSCPIPCFIHQRKNSQKRRSIIPQSRPGHLIIL